MKTMKNFLCIIFILAVYSNLSLAQQDYKVVKDFKAKYQEFQSSIKSADSLAQLNQIEADIYQFETDYSANKSLLDKSLYPDNFNSSFEKLRKELAVRKTDFTQISDLSNQVMELSLQIEDLNKKNDSLLVQVQDLAELSKVDKDKITKLQRTVYALRVSMRKRDELVMDMIDSLMPANLRNKGSLTSQEKQNIYSESQKKNILENMQLAIDENIRFLQATSLKPEDIDAIKEKQRAFEKTWRNFGPKLIAIYSERGQSIRDAQRIDSAFIAWHDAIIIETWNSINTDFSNSGINLSKFSSGRQFTNTLENYIQDQIKNAKAEGKASENYYMTFADSAWYGNIKPNWVPYLLDNEMLTEAQEDTIEANISEWQDVAVPNHNWMIYLVAGLIAIIIVLLIVKLKPKKKPDFETAKAGLSKQSGVSKPA